jgi:predicted dehydrogenase
MIRIHISRDEAATSRLHWNIGWLRGVALVPDPASADALVTASLQRARESPLPCLLVDSETISRQDLAALDPSRVMPAHPWRFRPDVLTVHRSLSSGQLGAPCLLRIHRWGGSIDAVRPIGLPAADLAHWFFSSLPATIHQLARPDYLQLHLGFPGGGMALIDTAQGTPFEGYHSLHLIGSEGAAYADDHHNRQLSRDSSGFDFDDSLYHEQVALANEAMLAEFVAGIRETRPWSVTLDDTLAALHTLKEVPDA